MAGRKRMVKIAREVLRDRESVSFQKWGTSSKNLNAKCEIIEFIPEINK